MLSPLPFSPLTEAATQSPHAHRLAELTLERSRAFQVEETIHTKAGASPALSWAQARMWAVEVAHDLNLAPERCKCAADVEKLSHALPFPTSSQAAFLSGHVQSPALRKLVQSCSSCCSCHCTRGHCICMLGQLCFPVPGIAVGLKSSGW